MDLKRVIGFPPVYRIPIFSDEPEVECGHGTITVKVKTASQKPSYIFAKGHFHKDGCHFKQTSSATFRFEECNVNRKREVALSMHLMIA